MANLALALLANRSEALSASVNAKMTNFLITRVTALPADQMKLFPMELVFAQLDTHAIHVEFALFHADKANSCSKEHVQYVLLILSSTLLSTAVAVLKDSTWTPMEFVKDYR
jgi:hypothetical protein